MSRANYRKGVLTNEEESRRKVANMRRMRAAKEVKPKETSGKSGFVEALAAIVSKGQGGGAGAGAGDEGGSSKGRGISKIGEGVADIVKTYKSKKAASK